MYNKYLQKIWIHIFSHLLWVMSLFLIIKSVMLLPGDSLIGLFSPLIGRYGWKTKQSQSSGGSCLIAIT